jgi:hypothetical protein
MHCGAGAILRASAEAIVRDAARHTRVSGLEIAVGMLDADFRYNRSQNKETGK